MGQYRLGSSLQFPLSGGPTAQTPERGKESKRERAIGRGEKEKKVAMWENERTEERKGCDGLFFDALFPKTWSGRHSQCQVSSSDHVGSHESRSLNFEAPN